MTDPYPLQAVPGEGRWVLMSEAVFEALVAASAQVQGVTLHVEWGTPDTRLVTFYGPSVVRVEPEPEGVA